MDFRLNQRRIGDGSSNSSSANSASNISDHNYATPVPVVTNDESTLTISSITSTNITSVTKLLLPPPQSPRCPPPPQKKRMRMKREPDRRASTGTSSSSFFNHPSPPPDTFITRYIDGEDYRSQFLIVPGSTYRQSSSTNRQDKLSETIKEGGGIVIEKEEENLTEEEKKHLIKILDLEFIKSNIRRQDILSMQVPYDCFSSNFILTQIYHRSIEVNEMNDADLNLYRVSPSTYLDYNANRILSGTLSWNEISHMPSDELSQAVSVKEVVLQFFPDALIRIWGRKRRIYTKQESQELLDLVCRLNGHGRVHSINMYKDVSIHHIRQRSSISLREHFRKTILPHVLAKDGYYTISSEDAQKFEESEQNRPKGRGRKKAKAN